MVTVALGNGSGHKKRGAASGCSSSPLPAPNPDAGCGCPSSPLHGELAASVCCIFVWLYCIPSLSHEPFVSFLPNHLHPSQLPLLLVSSLLLRLLASLISSLYTGWSGCYLLVSEFDPLVPLNPLSWMCIHPLHLLVVACFFWLEVEGLRLAWGKASVSRSVPGATTHCCGIKAEA